MSEPGGDRAGGDDLVRENLSALLRACDVVFGAISIGLSLFGTVLLLTGRANLSTVVALWFIPGFNLGWSLLSRRSERLDADLLRNAFALPVATFLYVADVGILRHMWLPCLMLLVHACLSFGLATRRPTLGYLLSLAYSGAILMASVMRFGSMDFVNARDALGVLMTGLVVSPVASRLGQSLVDARQQRDLAHEQKERAEATAAALADRSAELATTLERVQLGIRERERMEIELRHAQKLEAVGRLAAGVAHEINTPVQYANDNVQFVRDAIHDLLVLVDRLGDVQRSVAQGTPWQPAAQAATAAAEAADLPYLMLNIPKALDSAAEGLTRVATIVRAMKEFAQPSAKDMAAADLNQAIVNTLTVAHHELRYVAEVETELGEIPLVWCHLGELNQALLHIVINAAHAIGDVVTGTGAKGRLRIQTLRAEDEVVIAIADTGPGIPEASRDRVFDPFFTTKAVGRGTGQGLAIARSVIVDKHGGRIRLETETGKGTTFFIHLPVHGRYATSHAPDPAELLAHAASA